MSLLERIEQKYIPEPNSGCWLWLGAVTPTGYGTISIKHKTYHAHRTVYECLVGPIPAGLQLDHLCRVRSCVNPAHLEPVTNQVNLLRGKRSFSACKNGHPYTPDNIYTIKGYYRCCRTCKKLSDNRADQKRRAK